MPDCVRYPNDGLKIAYTYSVMSRDAFSIGCLLDGSHDSADSLNQEIVKFAESQGMEVDWEDYQEADAADRGEILNEMADDAVDWLNSNLDDRLPPFAAFSVEDNSLYIVPCIESARDDDDVHVCEDTPSYVLQINERGNTTLYRVTLEEVWGVV